jgi:hypothetical protein
MRNALMRAPDLARFAIELYKHPHLTVLDISMEMAPYTNEGDKTGDLQICDRGADGFRRNFVGVGVRGVESLSVWLTATRVLNKLRCERVGRQGWGRGGGGSRVGGRRPPPPAPVVSPYRRKCGCVGMVRYFGWR